MTTKNFWLVKGNPRFPIPGIEERCGDIESFLEHGSWSEWITYRRIKDGFNGCKSGDPVFLWSSGKLRSIIGLGSIREIHPDRLRFDINHISRRAFSAEQQVNIKDLRIAFNKHLSQAERDEARYIKPAVVATIYSVSHAQAEVIISLLSDKNLGNKVCKELSIWRTYIKSNPTEAAIPM